MRCAARTRRASYVNVHGGPEKVQRFSIQRKNLSIDQSINRYGNFEFNVFHCFSRSERMSNVSAVVEFRQHAEKTESSDGSPADEFDEAVGGLPVWRDEHGAAGVFAVVEAEKEAAPRVPFCFVIRAQNESATFELNHPDQYTEQITEVAERFENTIGQSADVSSETHAKNVEGIHFAGRMREADQIHGTSAIGEKRVQ